jgi:hypothetical protein
VLYLFLLGQLAVQAHLFVQVSVELPATKQHQEASAEFSQHIHPPSRQLSAFS